MFRSYGDAVEAIKYYERALKINPMRPEAHVAMSEFCIKEGNFEEAIAHWRKVLEVQPQAQLMHGYIGEAMLMLNRPAEAIEALEKEIEQLRGDLKNRPPRTAVPAERQAGNR